MLVLCLPDISLIVLRFQLDIRLLSVDSHSTEMQVVLSFFEQQPHGFLDLQESVTIGKLMEKLKLHSGGAR